MLLYISIDLGSIIISLFYIGTRKFDPFLVLSLVELMQIKFESKLKKYKVIHSKVTKRKKATEPKRGSRKKNSAKE